MKTAAYWIEKLGLLPHPEGGYFKETYRSKENIDSNHLPDRYQGSRQFGTAIYFMITSGNPSHFHRLKSDELWFFHTGSPLLLHMLLPSGEYQKVQLDGQEEWQAIIPHGAWFAAEVAGQDSYSLISCTVSPGFDFADFEMAEEAQLQKHYPLHHALLERLCL
jgi:predicted cupin superfamily sugar epimerase